MQLCVPLIKVPVGTGGPRALRGVASGTRSACLRLSDEDGAIVYRLKGCGNNDEGFTIRQNRANAQTGVPWRDVRGAAFPHCALRELAMTERVAVALAPLGVVSANSAVGLMRYSAPAQLVFGPRFPPACIVERTLGDRRLGTHVLAGLELLLPSLIDARAMDADALLAVFPPLRPRDASADGRVVSTAALFGDYCIGTALASLDAEAVAGDGLGPRGLEWPDLPRDGRTLADLTAASRALPERAPDPAAAPPAQYTREGAREMLPRWRAAWVEACGALSAALTSARAKADGGSMSAGAPVSSALAYLFSRVGYDAGRILRGLHAAKTSWGTYQDAMCGSTGH